ncbi:hypothetical protein EW15_1884 [Prochlorococcus sp. MIT 0801]|nr:hypothetical protein EW15_1884 [Prochlorococcus sp. MIT 0801]
MEIFAGPYQPLFALLPHECRASNAALIFFLHFYMKSSIKTTSLSSTEDDKSVTWAM